MEIYLFVKFKLIISESHGDNDEELSKPRMRIYTNQSYIFRNKAALEPDVVGLHCRLCNEQFLEEAACKRHEDSTEHQLKSLYRNDRYFVSYFPNVGIEVYYVI